MLVKFLSFVASVIGTARYKAVFLSCFVLLFSLAGIAGVAMWRGTATPNAASKLERAEADQENTLQGSPQLNQGRKQAIQDGAATQPEQSDSPAENNTQNGTTPSQGAANTDKPAKQTKPAEIALTSTAVSLPAGTTSEAITATTNQEAATLTWEIGTGEAAGLSIDRTQATGTASVTFTIKAREDISKGTYSVTVQLKDTAQNTMVTSRTISVTIL